MLVHGRNVAWEFLQKPKKVRKIFLQEGFNDEKINSLLANFKNVIETKTKFELDRLAKGVHQGIILEVEDYKYCSLSDLITDEEDQFLVILDHLEDPHNLGAIIRTCEAGGVGGIIIPKNRGVGVNSTVMKTSAGAIENVKIALVTNLKQTISLLKKEGFWIVGTDMEGKNYLDLDYRGKTAIVIGNEGEGMSRLVRESCDFTASIPMYGKVNSLNASVASGILIYEVLRQKR